MGDLPLFVREADEEIQVLKAKVAELEQENSGFRLRIEKQKEIIARDFQRIAELEQQRNNADLSTWDIFLTTDFAKKQLAIRDLEQQANALDELLTYPNHRFHGDSRVYYSEYSIKRAIEQLRNQSAKLKDSNNDIT